MGTFNVRNMRGMFCGATAFNQPLEKWDTSNVRHMHQMFYSAAAFNQPLEKWDTSKVELMRFMFYQCSAFNQPLRKWDMSKVRREEDMERMFDEADAFDQCFEPVWHYDSD